MGAFARAVVCTALIGLFCSIEGAIKRETRENERGAVPLAVHFKVSDGVAFSLTDTYVCNTGASFGSGSDSPREAFNALQALSLAIAATLMWIALVREPRLLPGAVCLVGGGTSNVLDRYTYGCVIDYLAVRTTVPIPKSLAFNVADLVLNAGIALTVYALFTHTDAPSDERKSTLAARVKQRAAEREKAEKRE